MIRYNLAVPNAAERILALAEAQAKHRQELESHVIRGDSLRANLGLASGLLIAIAGIAASAIMVCNGHDVAGSILGGGTLATVVGTFVYGTQVKRADAAKRQAPSGPPAQPRKQ